MKLIAFQSEVDNRAALSWNHSAARSFYSDCLYSPSLAEAVNVFAKYKTALLNSSWSQIKKNQELVNAIKTLLFVGVRKSRLTNDDVNNIGKGQIGLKKFNIVQSSRSIEVCFLNREQVSTSLSQSMVILLHGLWNDTASFLSNIDNLCDGNRTVVISSYTGHDFNSGRITENAIGRDVSLVVQHCIRVSNNKTVDIVGHSMGAANALLGVRDYLDHNPDGYIGNLILVSGYKNFEDAVIPTVRYLVKAFDRIRDSYQPCSAIDNIELVLDLLNTSEGYLFLLDIFKDQWVSDRNLEDLLHRYPNRIGRISLKHAMDDPVIFPVKLPFDSKILVSTFPPLALIRGGEHVRVAMTPTGRHFANNLNVGVLNSMLSGSC